MLLDLSAVDRIKGDVGYATWVWTLQVPSSRETYSQQCPITKASSFAYAQCYAFRSMLRFRSGALLVLKSKVPVPREAVGRKTPTFPSQLALALFNL